MKYLSGLALSLALLVGLPGATLAFQKIQLDIKPQGDFVLEPGKTEVNLKPGETALRTITITNRVDHETTFTLTEEDIRGTDDPTTAVALLGDERGPYSLKDLVKPEITTFTLNPGEQIIIPVSVSATAGTPPGGYYGAIVASTENTNAVSNTGQTKIISRLGSIFLVRVAGDVNESGHLSDFKTLGPKQTFYQKGPDGFEIQFTNDGNVHLVPYGVVTIKNLFGQTVGQIPVSAYFALPSSIRYRQVEWEKPSFLLGYYTATVDLYPGYGNEQTATQTRSLSFWILPLYIIIPLLAGLLVLVGIFYLIITRFEVRRKS